MTTHELPVTGRRPRFLPFWGSSQSKEQDERIEAKLDQLLRERGLDPGRISDRVNDDV